MNQGRQWAPKNLSFVKPFSFLRTKINKPFESSQNSNLRHKYIEFQLNNRYSVDSQVPFLVYIESIDQSIENFHLMSIAKKICAIANKKFINTVCIYANIDKYVNSKIINKTIYRNSLSSDDESSRSIREF